MLNETLHLILNIWIYFMIVTVLFSLLLCFSSNNVFSALNKKSVYSYIPIFNLYYILDGVKLSKIYLLLLFIPVTNILTIILILYRLSIIYNLTSKFSVGLILLPVVFLTILNYSGKYKIEEETKYDDVTDDMIYLLTEEEMNELNNTKSNENKVDNVFKGKGEKKEDVPAFRARSLNNTQENKEQEKIENIEL